MTKIAIVTGGTRGIGAAISKKLKLSKVKVIANYTSNDDAAENFSKENNIEVIKWDVSNYDECQKSVNKIYEDNKNIDILVNNAGITRDNLLLRMDEKSWKKVIDINLNSCFNLTKCAIREFMKKKEGVIINISSIVGVKGNAGQSNYSASKAGINGFTKSIALELGSRNIRCNAIAPGFIETDMTSQGDGKLLESWIESIPLKRAGSIDDVANLCSYLASDEASYITGQIIKVDGGLVT